MSVQKSIYHYCNYQERSHKEVRNKLYDLGCKTDEVNAHLSDLIEKGVLNEERYARAIVRGKFNLKKWGRVKILQLLKFQEVSEYNIRLAMKEIDEAEYEEVAKELGRKKLRDIKGEKNIFVKKKKIYTYLVQKGFEAYLVHEVINEIIKAP